MHAARSVAAVAGPDLFLLLLLLLLLSLVTLPRAIASSSSSAAAAFQVVTPSSSRPTEPPLPRSRRRRQSITVVQGQASSANQQLPSPPFVVYLTPGVPEAGGATALEVWYLKVGWVERLDAIQKSRAH